MTFFLACVSGLRKGDTWGIGDNELLIGRGRDCQVCIEDASVSRKHCRIYTDQGQIRFQDLGSRNPALVNGVPLSDALLHPGDEVAVGREVFMVQSEASPFSLARPQKPDALVSGTNDDPLLVNQDKSDTSGPRPRTIEEFVILHETAREFGQYNNVSAFVESAARRLKAHSRAQAVWIARAHDQDDLSFYPIPGMDDPAPTAPLGIMRRALREKKGLLVVTKDKTQPQGHHVSTLAIPVPLQDSSTIVAAVQAQAPEEAYTHSDVQFLTMMVGWLAPFLHSVEYLDQLKRDNERLRARAGESLALVGESRAMSRVRGRIREAAKSDLNVLITGETGTGKELAARLVHAHSKRGSGPMVTVNCAAIPRELFEGELFGHEKGAYTGANETAQGLVAHANGGTLFLDEVGDLSLDNQARILRVVEYGLFRPVGSSDEIRVNIRVLAATNRDLTTAMEKGEFRPDLYHRLNGFEVNIPPLRERVSDIPILAEHFFEMGKGEAKRTLTGIAPEAMTYLQSRRWPGNVRELRNCVLRGVAVARHETIQVQDVLYRAAGDTGVADQPLSLVDAEKQHIAVVLRKCGNNINDAAKILQVSASTLYRKISQYQITLHN